MLALRSAVALQRLSSHAGAAGVLSGQQYRHFAAPAKGAKAAKGAPKKKGGKESKLGNTLTAGSTGFAVGEKIPISIFKDVPDPVVKKDEEYPEWLWKANQLPTLNDCIRMAEEDKAKGVVNVKILKRIQRLSKVREIKAYNASQAS